MNLIPNCFTMELNRTKIVLNGKGQYNVEAE